MIIFIVISCLFSLCMASDVPKKSTIELDPTNEISLNDGSERVPFYKILADALLQDCSPLVRKDGYLIYPSLRTEEDVLAKMKEINEGLLPLSKQGKEDVASLLIERFMHQRFAEDYFKIFAKYYKIHPISIAKILHIVAHKYQVQESMHIQTPWKTPATDRHVPKELPRKMFVDLENFVQKASLEHELLLPASRAEEK